MYRRTTSPHCRIALAIGAALAGVIACAATPDATMHVAQRHRATAETAPARQPQGQFGAPLPGLNPAELAAFDAGADEFNSTEDANDGLGPIFNNTSCVSCHSVPASGGSSAIFVTRFGRDTGGVFDPLDGIGGSLLQDFAVDPAAQEHVPAQANVVAHRNSTALFGLGLMEAIPDQAIVAGAMRRQPDGISGLPSYVTDVASGQVRVGRFGWKAQQATVLSFAGDAYVNEMGITNRLFPTENAPNGSLALLQQFDHTIDPEDAVDPATGRGDVDALADFMRLLAPPPRLPVTGQARAGENVFGNVGCAACHTPTLFTGRSPIRAIDNKPVNLYSDLLLHDMGALGDGIVQGFATAREIKTPPLWGLRASGPYLHDGRAVTIDTAIRAHDGEARRARDRYATLPPPQRQQLLDFLQTL